MSRCFAVTDEWRTRRHDHKCGGGTMLCEGDSTPKIGHESKGVCEVERRYDVHVIS